MCRTALLAAIAVALTCSHSNAEGPYPLAELLLNPHQLAPASGPIPSRGTWQLGFDQKLDGGLKRTSSILIELEIANQQIIGYPADRDAPPDRKSAFFTGQLIPGKAPMVNLRRDVEQGYTAVYVGRVLSADNIVGSYTDNAGNSGDWSLTIATNRPVVDPLPEEKVVSDPQKIDPLRQKLSDDPYFESVLGAYGRAIRGDRSRFINLRPPNRNLWTDEIENALDGTLSYAEADYIGTANMWIPEPGLYELKLPGANVEFRVNGHRVEAGDLKLKAGLYEINIYTNHWGQPYMKYAQASVHHKESGTCIPFINAASEVEKFRNRKISGERVVEVCEYEPKRIKVEVSTEQ